MVAIVESESTMGCENCYNHQVRPNELAVAVIYQAKSECIFCEFPSHLLDCCPACEATCKKCSKQNVI